MVDHIARALNDVPEPSRLGPDASCGSNPDFLLGGRTSASAECRHWSGRAGRRSSCAILLARFSRLTNGCAWNAVSAFANCGRAVAHEHVPIGELGEPIASPRFIVGPVPVPTIGRQTKGK